MSAFDEMQAAETKPVYLPDWVRKVIREGFYQWAESAQNSHAIVFKKKILLFNVTILVKDCVPFLALLVGPRDVPVTR